MTCCMFRDLRITSNDSRLTVTDMPLLNELEGILLGRKLQMCRAYGVGDR